MGRHEMNLILHIGEILLRLKKDIDIRVGLGILDCRHRRLEISHKIISKLLKLIIAIDSCDNNPLRCPIRNEPISCSPHIIQFINNGIANVPSISGSIINICPLLNITDNGSSLLNLLMPTLQFLRINVIRVQISQKIKDILKKVGNVNRRHTLGLRLVLPAGSGRKEEETAGKAQCQNQFMELLHNTKC